MFPHYPGAQESHQCGFYHVGNVLCFGPKVGAPPLTSLPDRASHQVVCWGGLHVSFCKGLSTSHLVMIFLSCLLLWGCHCAIEEQPLCPITDSETAVVWWPSQSIFTDDLLCVQAGCFGDRQLACCSQEAGSFVEFRSVWNAFRAGLKGQWFVIYTVHCRYLCVILGRGFPARIRSPWLY